VKKQNCPCCGQSVEVRYKDMKRSDIDPWVYVEHTRPEVWGGELWIGPGLLAPLLGGRLVAASAVQGW
jgi:hypothetical protein